MKYNWLFTIPAVLILLFMVYRELTTSYNWKTSFEALITACIFFLYIGGIILYKRRSKDWRNNHLISINNLNVPTKMCQPRFYNANFRTPFFTVPVTGFRVK